MKRELQKNLFDYIGAGTISPKFLIDKLYKEENKKIEIDFINLKNFYKKKENFTDLELNNFIEENKDQLKVDYLDFNYVVINPQNLIGINEFNQSYFDKIDQIDVDIANGLKFETIVEKFNLKVIKKKNFKFSTNNIEIENKIFELRNNNFDIFEIGDDYILYNIGNIDVRKPDLNDEETKNEIMELVAQKDKFEYNRKLLEKIKNNKFDNSDFSKMGQNMIETIKLNSIRDNKNLKKFCTNFILNPNKFIYIN